MVVHAYERRSAGGVPGLYWEYTQRDPAQSAAMLVICTEDGFVMIVLGGAEGRVDDTMRGIIRMVGDSFAPAS